MLLTSESVGAGHPDKLADQISDAILDACLNDDPFSRVACEVLVTRGLVVVAGEITTKSYVDIQSVARSKILEVGYDSPIKGLDGNSCGIMVTLDSQSPDIAQGVDNLGAGDQGMMFGYATNETPGFLPPALAFSHELMRRVNDLSQQTDEFGPDAKCQVTVDYPFFATSRTFTVDTVVVSVQHRDHLSLDDVESFVRQELLTDALHVSPSVRVLINPTGRFVLGGPHADTGLTGRKIIVDTYGGVGRHGGGAFSGKDPTKVDRSGAYAARQLAKAIVHAKVADTAEVQLAYAIGVAEPVSVHVALHGNDTVAAEAIAAKIQSNIDLTPKGIIDRLGLRLFDRYQETARNGHFTDSSFPWEEEEGLKNIQEQIFG